MGQSFTIRILPSRETIWALISPTFSFFRISTGSSPLTILVRISGTHFGQRESVVRGQPSGGFCFSHDFRSGFSDHFGVNDVFGLIELNVLNTCHAAPAAAVAAFSAYLNGLCIRSLFSLSDTLKVNAPHVRTRFKIIELRRGAVRRG